LNRQFPYPAATDNQLRSWNNIGLFDRDTGAPEAYEAFAASADNSALLDERARAYLDVNCAHCHQPAGPAPTDIDLRFGTALADTSMVDTLPSAGDLAVADARIIAPGDRLRSVLWLRMERIDGERMPPVASHLVDESGLTLIGDWIDLL
jgi:mono/diheme cytochrome c family protein